MKIFLIGMPGIGKSSIGKNVSKMLNMNFEDLDSIIENTYQKTIAQLWEEQGESYFRKIESETLISINSEEDIIISCGGGTPIFNENMAWMNQNGLTLFLDLPIEIMAERIFFNTNSRPMFKNCKDQKEIGNLLNSIFQERKYFYFQSKIQVQLKGTFPYDFYLVKDKLLESLKISR